MAGSGAGYEIWTSKQQLVLTNTGSADRAHPGFRYCLYCGSAEPNGWAAGTLGAGGHQRPNPDHHPHGAGCSKSPTVVVLGNEFTTDIALIRFQLSGSVRLPPGSVVAKIVLTTVAEALALATAKLYGVEVSDIGAEFRVAMTSGGRTGHEVEVYLYDLTPGGAGFVRAAAQDAAALFDAALERLESCGCTHSCYECLRSYKNKWDHKYLNRGLAAGFIRHVVRGELPIVRVEDEQRLLRALATDLRESGRHIEVLDGGLRVVDRSDRIVVLSHPLVPEEPSSAAARVLAESEEVLVLDQLLVDNALPAAVMDATGALGPERNRHALPPFLREQENGCAVYRMSELGPGAWPAPVATVAIPGAPRNAFIAQLSHPTLERMADGVFSKDAWVVFVPAEPGAFVNDPRNDRTPRLLVKNQGAFNATRESWTFGLPILREDKVRILYNSRVAPRTEALCRSDVRILGQAFGVIVDGVLQLVGQA